MNTIRQSTSASQDKPGLSDSLQGPGLSLRLFGTKALQSGTARDLELHTYWEQHHKFNTEISDELPPLCEEILEWMSREQPGQKRPLRVLDLGSGSGRDAVAFARTGAIVAALDIARHGLQRIKPLPGLLALQADIRDRLPFSNESFDAVYSHLVLSGALNEGEITFIFSEIYRILRGQGVLWLQVRSTDDPTYKRLPQRGSGYYSLGDTGLHFYSKRTLRQYSKDFETILLEPRALTMDGETYGVLQLIANKPGHAD